jgi:sporulation-control protein
MFKKFLAKLGKGAAQVNLVLDKQEYKPGEEIRGELIIQGGTVEQEINKIDIDLLMSVRSGDHEQTALVRRISFTERFTIGPSETKTLPFQYELPKNLLLSGYSVSYAFVTHLDIAGGVDSTDRDPIHVKPPERLQNILNAFQSLGFHEKYGSRKFNGHLQEFELQPTTWFKNEIEEVEFVAAVEEEGISMLLETDLRTFSGEKEIRRELWLENSLLDDPEQLAVYLREVIGEMVHEPGRFHSYDKKHFHHKVSGLPGAIGAFAIGLIAAEILDEVFEEAGDAAEDPIGDFFDDGDADSGDDDGDFFDELGDFFDGGDFDD